MIHPVTRSLLAAATTLLAAASLAAQEPTGPVEPETVAPASTQDTVFADGADGAEAAADTTPPGVAAPGPSAAADTIPVPETWGALDPGQGFEVANTELGALYISAYGLFRYLNQLPADATYTDHLGRTQEIHTRNDIQFHRVQIFAKGWVYTPRLRYVMNVWTVNATGQVAVVGSITYHFNRGFSLAGGVNGMPGTRSLGGSHPYWLGYDRVMADEFVRPGFTSALWATGEPLSRFHYTAMIGTNLSQLGISAREDTRDLAYGATVWWMPTTGEFGPRGAYGDFERHEKLATRFGTSWTFSREDRFSQVAQGPENTSIRLSDALNLFETGSLAEGVTLQKADYNLNSVDAGIKYRGLWLQAEFFLRHLGRFEADGPVPLDRIVDRAFYVQGSYVVLPKTLELYAATSGVDGEFNDAWEVLGGVNWYPVKNRNFRVNGQVIRVDRSPVSSVFGYYVGGQTGTTVSFAAGVLF